MRWSIALRLTVWYAATGFVLVAASAFIQYRALRDDLAKEDDRLLLETLAAAQAAGVAPEVMSATSTDLGPVVRVLDANCRELNRSLLPADLTPVCRVQVGDEPVFRTWRSPKGRTWRITTQRLDRTPTQWVEVALDRWTDESILADFRGKLLLILPAALVLAMTLGYALARRGLKPLDVLASRVSRIDARSLDQRLSERDAAPEIHALTASFDEMLLRLQHAFGALSEFSADLAHELRTPLHVLRQQAEVALSRARTADEYREVLGSSLEEMDRLQRMIDDTLFLARAEDPRAMIDRAPLPVAAELTSVAEFMEALASERSIRIEVDASPMLRLNADRMLIRRALVNVVANAIRHSRANSDIRLSAFEADDAVIVRATDEGDGIAPDALSHVFERHFRASANGPGQYDGAGLGLAIVRSVMTLHGGSAEMESEVGRGSRVTLRFPRA